MIERIEASGGDTAGARAVLEAACAGFDAEDAALLEANDACVKDMEAAAIAWAAGAAGLSAPVLALKVVTDIVDGDNTCTAYLLECEQGFYATTGWDPVSGWGSVAYERLDPLLA